MPPTPRPPPENSRASLFRSHDRDAGLATDRSCSEKLLPPHSLTGARRFDDPVNQPKMRGDHFSPVAVRKIVQPTPQAGLDTIRGQQHRQNQRLMPAPNYRADEIPQFQGHAIANGRRGVIAQGEVMNADKRPELPSSSFRRTGTMAEPLAVLYWDTSAFLSFFFADEHSSQAQKLESSSGAVHLLSSLAHTEASAVIARMIKGGVLDLDSAATVHSHGQQCMAGAERFA
jgi:hypothetical protein